MTTNTKVAHWLHDRAAEMIDGDDDAFPDALRALVKRLLLEENATASPTPAIYCPNCGATGFPPIGHSWPSLEPWWIDGAKLCCTECGACLVVRADGERASLELDEPGPAERKPPAWIPDPEGGEYLAIPGDPGVHLGAWVNSGYGPHWSVAFDKQGCFPQHAETLDEAKADAVACAERELSAIVAKGEEAARVLSVLRGSQ